MSTMDTHYVLGAAELFTLFFVTLGPLKLLGPFARATAKVPAEQLRGLALRITALAVAIAIAGGFLGRTVLASWMVDVLVLRFATGLILFVVAFRLVMQQYEPPGDAAPVAGPAPFGRRWLLRLLRAGSPRPWPVRRPGVGRGRAR